MRIKNYFIYTLVLTSSLFNLNIHAQYFSGTLDYVHYQNIDTLGNKLNDYKGYGVSAQKGYAFLDLLMFDDSKLYITDILYGGIGVNLGNKNQAFSGAVSVLWNFSLAAGYRSKPFGFAISYTLFNGSYITDLQDDWHVNNKGQLTASIKYDKLMAQGGISTQKSINKSWYAQVNFFIYDDDEPLYILARFENNQTFFKGKISKVAQFSIGVAFDMTTTGLRNLD